MPLYIYNPTERETMSKDTTTPTPQRMGRPPLPPSDRKTVVVFVRMSPTDAAKLDKRRGDTPRAEWLRKLATL